MNLNEMMRAKCGLPVDMAERLEKQMDAINCKLLDTCSPHLLHIRIGCTSNEHAEMLANRLKDFGCKATVLHASIMCNPAVSIFVTEHQSIYPSGHTHFDLDEDFQIMPPRLPDTKEAKH